MSELVKSEGSWLPALLNGDNPDLAIPKPFQREIFLYDTYIAGTGYVDGLDELEPHLQLDDKLDFFREPDNPHDSWAIVIRNSGGVKLGYVPRADNVIFSRLMDAGKLLFGRISAKELDGAWCRIEIKVYLHD